MTCNSTSSPDTELLIITGEPAFAAKTATNLSTAPSEPALTNELSVNIAETSPPEGISAGPKSGENVLANVRSVSV